MSTRADRDEIKNEKSFSKIDAKILEIDKKIQKLEEFENRVKLGSKRLLWAIYVLGSLVVFLGTVLQIIKSWPAFK